MFLIRYLLLGQHLHDGDGDDDEMNEFHKVNGGNGGSTKSSGWLRKGDSVPPMKENNRPRGYLASKLQSLFDQDEDFDVKASLEAAVSTAKTKLPGFDLSRINLDSDITQEQLIEAVSMIDMNAAGGIPKRKMYERGRRLEGDWNNQEEVFPTDNPFFGNFERMPDMKSFYNGGNKIFRQAILNAHANVRKHQYPL